LNKDLILEEARAWLSLEQEGEELETNQKFLSWINVSRENKNIFIEEKKFRQSIQALSSTYKQKKVQEIKDELKKENIYSKLRFITPLAACFVLIIFAFTFTSKDKKYNKNIYSQSIVMQDIEMPDNSKISLDAKTDIEITYTEDIREVLLKKGRALFEVTANKDIPFYVKSNFTLIKVVGTKFEVKKEENKTKVSVLEGVVIVRHGFHEKSKILARLEKGDTLDISKSGKEKKLGKSLPNKIATWKNEKLIFEQTSLKDVVNEFSKYLDYEIKIDLLKNDNYPISGEFSVYEFDKFLEFLPLIHPIKIQRNDKNQIILQNNS